MVKEALLMQILAPDILADARGLSAALHVMGLALGMALWVFGWRNHRFWVVLAMTVGAGTLGLAEASTFNSHPLTAAVLLAVAAGLLALSLVRLVTFAAGGIFALIAVRALAPSFDEPLVPFLTGGLVAHLLFRLWVMALTSFCGTLLMSYAGLCLADQLGKLDAVAWTEQRTQILNWLCGAVTVLGLFVQFLIERRLAAKGASKKSKDSSKGGDKKEKSSDKPFPWSLGETLFRKAG
jgi:hypothetical protein